MRLRCLCLLVALSVVEPGPLSADVRLPAILSDHLVLCRSAATAVWGHADPDESVRVAIAGQTAETKAGADGAWRVTLDLAKAPPGPFELRVEGKNQLVIADVLVGETWLASGQSNMEMMLALTAEADKEIAASANPNLRQFRVEKLARPQLQDDCRGQWVAAGPETSGMFTAVGYYFGKQVQQTLGVPVGIVNNSWGGTFSEAWTSREAIRSVEKLRIADDQRRQAAADYPAQKKAYVEAMKAWLLDNERQDDHRPSPAAFAGEDVSTEDWTTVRLPGKIAGPGLPTQGVIWIRKQIDVPAEAIVPGWDFKILLGNIEGFEQVYWNGQKVSETPYERMPGAGYQRYFAIPREQMRTGRNTLAVRIFAPALPPVVAAAEQSFWAGPINLVGDWQARGERAFPPLPAERLATYPQPPARPPAMMAGDIFNGIIHPLLPFALSGVIWYQGESNSGRAFQYRTAFPLLIEDWRRQWGQPDLPFYFCQITAYGPKPGAPGESDWAELREAQTMTLRLPNTGQAITIDIGEAADAHARRKREVGERLARIALAKHYGRGGVFSGPTYESMTVEGDHVRIRFRDTDGGLAPRPLPATYDVVSRLGKTAPLVRNSPGGELEGFAICGEDHRWVWADAKIDGDTVLVWSSRVAKPVAVRYGWADCPTVNLYNGAGLPAGPFRTDDFPARTASKEFGPGS